MKSRIFIGNIVTYKIVTIDSWQLKTDWHKIDS